MQATRYPKIAGRLFDIAFRAVTEPVLATSLITWEELERDLVAAAPRCQQCRLGILSS
jgi:hypothetical protein